MRLEFTYPFLAEVSVNHAYNRGCPRYGKKAQVKLWLDGLTLIVKNKLQHLSRDLKPPVALRVVLFSPKRTGRIDVGNYMKLIEDAVFAALDFDDNDLNLIRGPYSGVRGSGYFAIILEEVDRDSIYSERDREFFFTDERFTCAD